jgi:biotin carboxyl carrier protein
VFWITIEGVGEARLTRVEAGRRRSREKTEGSLSSPMPGKVVKVEVAVGETVATGQDLVVVEAMKMEIKISTPIPGTVRAVHVREGDPCDAGQVLVEVAH